MSLAATVSAMVAAGCSAEQVEAVVRAHEAEIDWKAEAKRASRRSGNAERQRRWRSANNAVTERDGALCDVTARDAPPLDKETSPTPPKEIKPHPERVSDCNRALPSVSADFEEFYAAYPKRENRKIAFGRYEALRRSGVPHARIMAGLKHWVGKWAAEHTARQFIPTPDVWLNKGKFDDEVVVELPLPNSRAPPPNGRSPSREGAMSLRNQALQDEFDATSRHDESLRESTGPDADIDRIRTIGWAGRA